MGVILVWLNPILDPLILRTKIIIQQNFKKTITAKIYVCTLEELAEAVIDEMSNGKRPQWEQDYIKLVIPHLEGQYLQGKNEIWLVEGKGEIKHVILHEMIHSIQICQPNRENINDYICYRLLKDDGFIDQSIIIEWKEIEKTVGFKKILNRIITQGDCEEF